jgi:hypothetical protein
MLPRFLVTTPLTRALPGQVVAPWGVTPNFLASAESVPSVEAPVVGFPGLSEVPVPPDGAVVDVPPESLDGLPSSAFFPQPERANIVKSAMEIVN